MGANGGGPAVLWFRRDLRLRDHPALLAAFESGGGDVLPLFVLDPRLRRPSGRNRLAFLARNLRALDEALGGRLVVRTGDPAAVVPAVSAEVEAVAVHATADFGPYGRRRDDAVASALQGAGRALVTTGSPYLVAPGTIRKASGEAFRVFSPFYKAWSRLDPEPPAGAPDGVRFVELGGDPLPSDEPTARDLPPAGEEAALARLEEFRSRLVTYADDRNAPGTDGTSRMSPYLKYGVVHPRQLLHGLGRTKGEDRFRFEVAWRDFYADVLWHHPESVHEPLQPKMADMAYDRGVEADERFRAWTEGRTGYPIVDAGMRQLVSEGWMHNRVRMITASFLVKDLHLDWRRGARFFLQHLVDGDLASNHHGWQWVAGTGTDPAPYYRIFNPVLQGEKFDPTGAYVRRYVPELATVPDAVIHHPWDDPSLLPFGDYPERIVRHEDERREALARHRAATG